MKRYLWVLESSDARNGPWVRYHVCSSRSYARWMRNKDYPFWRIVRYVSDR